MNAQTRKPANLTLDAALLAEARALKVNLSRAAEEGIRHAVSERRKRAWQAENAAALESSNRFVETSGLPLAQYRQF